jgi:alpha-beta hydrolase superfamily lysophospholipase
VNHRQETLSGSNGDAIYAQSWLPGGAPKAALLLLHGLAEHSGRYMNLVEHLVQVGYAVYTFDLVGHGHSEGERAYVRRFSEYSAMVDAYQAQVRERAPRVPLFAFGHSMGAVIAADYVLSHDSELSGIVLSGLSVEMPADVTPATILAAKVLSALAPKLRVQALASSTLSRDPAVVQGYDEDPLVYRGRIPARTGVELLQAQDRVLAHAHQITLPVLMVHGGEDRLCPLRAARSFYESLGSPDKTLQVYEGFYHEVCNEPERDLVLDDIAAWIQARL